MAGLYVDYGQLFLKHLPNFPKDDILKIMEFVQHIQRFGFDGLLGRNKSSEYVPKDNPYWLERLKYAQQHRLWHYHIGIPNYNLSEK